MSMEKNLLLCYKDVYKRQVITSGGVDVNELSPKTMESKLCRNLYFAGEVIDVDAYTCLLYTSRCV